MTINLSSYKMILVWTIHVVLTPLLQTKEDLISQFSVIRFRCWHIVIDNADSKLIRQSISRQQSNSLIRGYYFWKQIDSLINCIVNMLVFSLSSIFPAVGKKKIISRKRNDICMEIVMLWFKIWFINVRWSMKLTGWQK